ncbi:MAG: hypothetical protein K940chlam9_00947 [Chlamydiae bacterium]|nr:hypothetical protein [Chlamydiota bacterium]
MHEYLSLSLTLFLVIDALGNLPTFLYLLKPIEKKKQKRIVLRELGFSLLIMALFHYVGRMLLETLNISQNTTQIAGGIILFLIAIRLIFSQEEEKMKWGEKEPFVVPIATPLVAGPSVFAVVTISSQKPTDDLLVLGAILTSWFLSCLVFIFGGYIYKGMKEKGLLACQRLMGLIVAMISVQVFLEGLQGILGS